MRKKLRHNCQPNTIGTIGSTILLFSEFFKRRGHVHLCEIGREQVSVFVEHEQDRGMAPISVDGRLKALYAFLNYLVEHDVMAAEVIKRKLRIKVPDALPRAIDPDDVNFLWPCNKHHIVSCQVPFWQYAYLSPGSNQSAKLMKALI